MRAQRPVSVTPPRFTAADRLFHELIVDAADNAVLSAIYRTLRERQTLFTSVMVRGRADRMQAAIDEHERILDDAARRRPGRRSAARSTTTCSGRSRWHGTRM